MQHVCWNLTFVSTPGCLQVHVRLHQAAKWWQQGHLDDRDTCFFISCSSSHLPFASEEYDSIKPYSNVTLGQRSRRTMLPQRLQHATGMTSSRSFEKWLSKRQATSDVALVPDRHRRVKDANSPFLLSCCLTHCRQRHQRAQQQSNHHPG